MSNPIILIHGYSDVPESFKKWEKILTDHGLDATNVHVCGYRSLTNEVTIKDIAEGFDRALRLRAGLSADEPFDAIVHSTGMLVIRAWLTTYAKQEKRKRRLKRLIALAPASFGSPLAHKGRSWLGAIFKGNRSLGPDFMDAGDLILDGLELASRYTWDLAHLDLLSEDVFYGSDPDTPYVFTFCGADNYGGLQGLVTNPKGTDGTVRWAGCSLNTRKITLNLTVDEDEDTTVTKRDFGKWHNDKRSNLTIPFIPIPKLNHGSIIEEPSTELIDLVVKALKVSSKEEFNDWNQMAIQQTAKTLATMTPWQQFLVRAIDERGDAITDYHVTFKAGYRENPAKLKPIEVDVHVYSGDKSLRSFHFNLAELDLENLARLRIEIIASSGTELVKYHGHIDQFEGEDKNEWESATRQWTAVFDMDQLITNKDVNLFVPFTTSLIELQLNREPELGLPNERRVTWFVER